MRATGPPDRHRRAYLKSHRRLRESKKSTSISTKKRSIRETTHQRHKNREDKADFGNFDNAWCTNSDEVAAVMKDVKKAWIAFKVMAAGAISPREAFQYSFDNGADFVLAGMFDFQITEDVEITKQALAKVNRTRPWMA